MVPNSKLPPVEDGTKQMAGTDSHVGISIEFCVAILQRKIDRRDDDAVIMLFMLLSHRSTLTDEGVD